MAKDNYLQLGENKEGFEIVTESAVMGLPDRVSGDMLWNLWDIGSKFGQEGYKGLGFKATPLVLELYDFRNNGIGGAAGFTVGKARGTGIMDEGIFMFQLENNMQIIWDKGISAEEVSDIIKEIDEYSISKGHMRDGVRIAFGNPSSTGSGKMIVGQVFARKGTVMMVMPGDIEGTLHGFDHPELLVALEMGVLKLLCLASEKDEIIADMGAKLKRLEEMGIKPEQVANMSVEEIIELRKIFTLV